MFPRSTDKNSYPKQFIDSFNGTLKSMLDNDPKPKVENNARDGPKVNIKIPFHHQVIFDKLMLMKKLLQKIIPQANIHIITTCFRVENLVSKYRKIEIEQNQKHDLVYIFRCCCEEGTYVGETGLTLAARIESHVRQKQLSAITAHVKTCPQFTKSFQEFRDQNHFADVPSILKRYIGRYFEKLKFTNGFHERRFMESLLIKQYSPNLNSQVNSRPLEILY